MDVGSQYTCCELAQVTQENTDDNSEIVLRGVLLQNVSMFLSTKENQVNVTPVENDDIAQYSASLIGASIAGCTSAFDCILDAAQKDVLSDMPLEEIINTRLPCDFPFPAFWVHKTVCLAIAPLHMACWRLDVAMIRKLLSLGADPNGLAWEEFGAIFNSDEVEEMGGPELKEYFRLCVDGRPEGSQAWVTLQGLKFDAALGFSPLHFIALGLRNPPMYLLSEGTKLGIIHNICADYEEAIHASRTGDGRQSSHHKVNPAQTHERSDNSTRCEIVQECIKALLTAGADQNVGRASFLSFYFPLDMIIQPPIKVYFASRLARSSQTSGCLRRQNFELNLLPILAATQTLLQSGSKLSSEFLFAHRWNLRHLDCFYTTGPTAAVAHFVELLLQSGLFPDNGQILDPATDAISFIDYCQQLKNACTMEDIRKFIVDAVNMCPHESLVALIMKWCSLRVVHLFIQAAKLVIAESQFSHSYLSGLIDIAMNEQLSSLKTLCKRLIVRSIGSTVENIDLLPLPPPLLRDLRMMRY